MRSYCAVYVDAGYLLAAAATRVTGTSLRSGVRVDFPALVQGLVDQAEADSGLRLLRVNWYDSGGRSGGMPDMQQEEIGFLPRVKLRLGRLSRGGEQKGVDLRIGLDIAMQGRERVADVMYLVSGDDDLTEAVEEAQDHGVQVVIMAVPRQSGKPHAVARHLERSSDGLILLNSDFIDSAVRPAGHPAGMLAALGGEPTSSEEESSQQSADSEDDGTQPEAADKQSADGNAAEAPDDEPTTVSQESESSTTEGEAASESDEVSSSKKSPKGKPTPSVLAGKKADVVTPPTVVPITPSLGLLDASAVPVEDVDTTVGRVVASWCSTASADDLAKLRDSQPFIPSDIDRTLLADLGDQMGTEDMDDGTRHLLRARFWDYVGRIKLN